MPDLLDQQYELVAVDQLHQHPDNPRRGDVELIKESIDRHGFYGAIIVQRSTNRVLAGNHRLAAAKDQHIDQLPVIWVDCDDQTARRILLADNRTAERATWDYESLAAVLGAIRTTDDDLAGLGWKDYELEALLGAEWHPQPSEDDLESFTNDPKAAHTIKLNDSQWRVVAEALDKARDGLDVDDATALVGMCQEYLGV